MAAKTASDTRQRAELRGVRDWARKARDATERRDAAVVAASATGASLRTIAAEAGLTHTAIAKILARTGGDA